MGCTFIDIFQEASVNQKHLSINLGWSSFITILLPTINELTAVLQQRENPGHCGKMAYRA